MQPDERTDIIAAVWSASAGLSGMLCELMSSLLPTQEHQRPAEASICREPWPRSSAGRAEEAWAVSTSGLWWMVAEGKCAWQDKQTQSCLLSCSRDTVEAVSVLVIVAFFGLFVGVGVPINNRCDGQQPLNCKCVLWLGRLLFLNL